jgi:peptide/nickel transport system substrate-binding protein
VRSTSRALIAVTALVLVTSLAACSSGDDDPDAPSALRIGFDSTHFDFNGSPLDGLTMNYSYFAGRATYESLLAVDPETSESVGLLAEDFELADDRKHMTIDLRQNVDFTDGTHLDAAALVEYLDLLFASDGYFHRATVLDTYHLTVEATDEYSVELTTTTAMDEAFFEGFLEGTGISSPDAAADREALKEQPVGTGPYLLEEFVPGVSASYVRNPDYWNPDAYGFDTLEYVAFEDEIASSNALKSGQVDAIVIGTASLLPELEGQGFQIAASGGTYRTLIITDFAGDLVPALGDVRVRQAIAMAFDQEAMVENIELGYASTGDEPFAPSQPAYVEDGADRYPYDVEAARQLLAEAGYADGFDLRIPSAEVAYYPSDFEPIIGQSLSELGIRVTFEQQADSAALIGAWLGGEFPAIFTNLGYTQTVSQFQGATPSLGGHFADDATFDELTTRMSNGTLEEYDAAASELGEYLLDQSWYVPLTHISAVRVAHDADLAVQLSPERLFIALSDFQPAD